MSSLQENNFTDIVIKDRNDWYLKKAKKELEDIEGPLYQKVLDVLGLEETIGAIDIWKKLIGVLEIGEHRPGHFRAIKKIIKQDSKWERKAAKTKLRELSYEYEGGIIDFEEELRELLEDNDYEIEDISYKTGEKRLVVTFYELEVEQIFIVVFPEVSKAEFKEIRRYIKDEMEEWSRKKSSSKNRTLHYAYDGSGEDFESKLEELFEDEEFGEAVIDYETGSNKLVVTFE